MPSQAKLFFDRHLEYLAQNDLTGMVNESYHADAILYNAFPIYADLPPWNVARGREDILKLFKDYLGNLWSTRVPRLQHRAILQIGGFLGDPALIHLLLTL